LQSTAGIPHILEVDREIIRATHFLRQRRAELDELFGRAEGPIGSRELTLVQALARWFAE
jgi:hypothetical protein